MSDKQTAHVSMFSSIESLRFTSRRDCDASAPSIALYVSSVSTVEDAGTVPASGSAFGDSTGLCWDAELGGDHGWTGAAGWGLLDPAVALGGAAGSSGSDNTLCCTLAS
jgi:hypothetical protein